MLRARQRPDAIPDPPAPGWPALYKTVREADVNKVEDCREDIDTLLVFAGLYSAVLTAFVIESYTHLQQDPQDVIIGLLQQIATQNFIYGPGFVNSTSSASPPSPFEPPLWAVRVNVLWFTSLLLSLASASFGILVKQWLREYLAIEYTVPQQRLRARQYRYPALAQWRVFEIAAFLPLLLQLSLGLFFLGLCFFTAAVHSSIGRTTTPFVAAWAFLLLVTTIAPLFSPRCPFKTTSLKRSLKVARRHFIFPSARYMVAVGRLLVSLSIFCARAATPPCLGADRPFFKVVSRGFACVGSVLFTARRAVERDNRGNSLYIRLLSSAVDRIDDIPSPLVRYPAIGVVFVLALPHIVAVLVVGELGAHASEGLEVTEEEEELVEKEGEDSEILLSIDSLMSDDGLLPSMLDAVQQQAGIDPAKTVEFITQMAKRRVDRELDTGRLLFRAGALEVPDLDIFTKFAWSTIVEVLTHALRHHSPPVLDASNHDHHWVFGAISILLSHPQPNIVAIREVVAIPPKISPHFCTGGVTSNQRPNSISAHAGTGSPCSNHSEMCLRCITDTYKVLLCQDPKHSHPSLRHLLDAHMSSAFAILSKSLLRDLYSVTVPFFLSDTGSSPGLWEEITGTHEALHIILQFGRWDDAARVCRRMLLTESGTRMLLVQFTALHPQCRISKNGREIIGDVYQSLSEEDYVRIRSNLASACERFFNGDNDDDVPLDYVKLYTVFYRWASYGLGARALAKAIEKYHRTQGWRKELGHGDYWYSDGESPTPEELLEKDQALACEILKEWWNLDTELRDALRLFVPEAHTDGALLSTRESGHSGYTTRAGPMLGMELVENSNLEGERGGTSSRPAPRVNGEGGMVESETSDGAEARGEQQEDPHTTERDMVDEGRDAGEGACAAASCVVGEL